MQSVDCSSGLIRLCASDSSTLLGMGLGKLFKHWIKVDLDVEVRRYHSISCKRYGRIDNTIISVASRAWMTFFLLIKVAWSAVNLFYEHLYNVLHESDYYCLAHNFEFYLLTLIWSLLNPKWLLATLFSEIGLSLYDDVSLVVSIRIWAWKITMPQLEYNIWVWFMHFMTWWYNNFVFGLLWLFLIQLHLIIILTSDSTIEMFNTIARN